MHGTLPSGLPQALHATRCRHSEGWEDRKQESNLRRTFDFEAAYHIGCIFIIPITPV